MDLLLAGNVVAYCFQLAIITVACAGLPRLLRVHAPAVQYLFWRVLLGLALALPLIQPWTPTRAVVVLTSTTVSHAVGSGAWTGAPAPIVLNQFVLIAIAWVLIGGVLMRLAALAVGFWRLRKLQIRNAKDASQEFSDLQRWIGTNATIRWSSEISHPVTFGWPRSYILLPPAVRTLDRTAARALVAHELFHVRRRDWLWQVAEEIVRAIFWFHPAMWWLVSRVQLARETVVDELSILATNSRRAYMDTLLAFADNSGPLTASAFSRRRHLVHRITLLSREGSMSARRVTFASLVLATALAGSSVVAVRAFPLLQQPRDPVPGQLSPEQRSLLDRAVEEARAALAREPDAPDLHHRLAAAIRDRTVKDPDMNASARLSNLQEAIASEDAALRVRPDYVAALTMKAGLLRLVAANTVDMTARARALAAADATETTLHEAMAPKTPESVDFQTQAEAAKALRVGSNMKPPAKLKDVRPVYPDDAKASGVQGVVILETLIDKTGHVASARVLRSIPMLDDAALDAVRQWEYQPVLLNGAPVSVIMTVTVNFTLQ